MPAPTQRFTIMVAKDTGAILGDVAGILAAERNDPKLGDAWIEEVNAAAGIRPGTDNPSREQLKRVLLETGRRIVRELEPPTKAHPQRLHGSAEGGPLRGAGLEEPDGIRERPDRSQDSKSCAPAPGAPTGAQHHVMGGAKTTCEVKAEPTAG